MYQNRRDNGNTTRFTTERCDNIEECIEVINNYTSDGQSVVVCMPERSSCKPWIVIPEGIFALVTTSGRLVGIWEPGLHWCAPWTRVEYVVSRQNLMFQIPEIQCPTQDNMMIKVSVSAVVQMQLKGADLEKSVDQLYQVCLNVTDFNQLLEQVIQERIRVLARQVPSKRAYSIKGKEQQEGMLAYLKEKFKDKALEVKSLIIKSITLPQDVGVQLQDSTLVAFRKTLERKQQCYSLATKNDEEALKLLKVKYVELRHKIEENLKTKEAKVDKEIQKIAQMNQKLGAEIREETSNKVNVINANTELKENEIIAETNMIKTEMLAQGEADAATTKANADAFAVQVVSQAQTQAAQSIGQAIALEGQAEQEKLKSEAMKRRHQQAIESIRASDNLGNQAFNLYTKDQDYLLALKAQKEALRLLS